jgi:hypothetical protein
MAQLAWSDLIIEPVTPDDAKVWLANWSRWVQGRVSPLFMSKFGDWFLRTMDGGTHELSVIEGTYKKIASSPEEFTKLVNSQDWQEEHLLSYHVLQLHERGLVPTPKQCYGFAPHPALLGNIQLDQVMIFEIGAWQYICAQTFFPMKSTDT